MSMQISVDELFDYTAWQREKWFEQMRKDGGQVLKTSAGAHGDGRFQVVGELVRHIFSAEQRYADRLLGRALTDTASVPHDNLEALYQFGQQSRKDFQEAQLWAASFEPKRDRPRMHGFAERAHGVDCSPARQFSRR